ncbi:Uma2 family endonuclease [Anaerolineales bacterium HSG25]|nr:Uma2 family endonuclease [Anaerolineales bacterium HSG25]
MSVAILEPIVEYEPILYPDSDGLPMADNTKQFDWIVKIKLGLENLFRDNPNIFVAGDLLWYPVQGNNKIRRAPDAMVAFGRPKGHRGSYQQWKEANIAPHVVFEVLSPSITTPEMKQKFQFYTDYEVEEYYIYDPDHGTLKGYKRVGQTLERILSMRGWVSPRLGVRFDLDGLDLCLYYPNGRPFESYLEIARRADRAKARRQEAEARAIAETRADMETKARVIAEARIRELEAKLKQLEGSS